MFDTQKKSLYAYVSTCPALWLFSALIRVSAAAASSNAQLTEDVSLRNTSGSAKALPSAVDNLPMPSACVNQVVQGKKKQKSANCSYITKHYYLGEKNGIVSIEKADNQNIRLIIILPQMSKGHCIFTRHVLICPIPNSKYNVT